MYIEAAHHSADFNHSTFGAVAGLCESMGRGLRFLYAHTDSASPDRNLGESIIKITIIRTKKRIMKTRILSIVTLLLMAATGAVAQTEALLTTITATAKEQASYSTANVATVSFSYTAGGSSAYLANWGWWGYGWSATVTAAEGYTITKCIFYDNTDHTATDSEAPFVVETTEEDKQPKVNGSYIYQYSSSAGIKKIEVYGYVTPTTNEGATGEYWATYYNSAQGYTADANTTVYQAAVNSGKTAVVLTEVTGREIPAGKGVVLKSSAATITLTPTTTTQTLEGNELTGVDVATAAPSNAYCLSKETTGSARGVGFYTYTGPGTGTIPAHRAYLVVAGGPSLTRGFLGFGDDDNTTGISLPEAVVIENDGPIYDLSGRRIIGQPQKGIYVKNGKKFVIK